MKQKIVNILKWILELSLFCGYFYILFVNLVCGFSYGGVDSKSQAIKIFLISLFLATALPGVIWYQHHRIRKLEKILKTLLKK
ncbi:hypothetical protein [Parablautia sp. Marseille-Q6255]|uniref:hypothetical protein n=1 Tax=Parablautia sp. Marseille-Q6255 TaxID=3039593 RepID=UPI0024BC952D|nr:hypothetical protein [Parablautia sp. Marseille-Q6255]